MSDLTSIEKVKLEKLLEMDRGYVLDFSNTTFQEFVLENLNINIYDEKYNYQSGSKANRLRGFWKEESNSTVGKLIEKLLEYWRIKKSIALKAITTQEENLFNECQKIVTRLQGYNKNNSNQDSLKKEKFSSLRSSLLLKFDRFAALEKSEDKKQRGFLLEELLERIFSLYEITTQKSFQRNEGGEQIDGAFKDDRLLFIGPDGRLYSKADDLELHRSGTTQFNHIELVDIQVEQYESTAVTVVLADLAGIFKGQVFGGYSRYVRTWVFGNKGWRIVSGSVCAVADPS